MPDKFVWTLKQNRILVFYFTVKGKFGVPNKFYRALKQNTTVLLNENLVFVVAWAHNVIQVHIYAMAPFPRVGCYCLLAKFTIWIVYLDTIRKLLTI